tara:strand:+ start:93 stop:449 length:357 start_codon:yes stop_codon:yes gene_type:complete
MNSIFGHCHCKKVKFKVKADSLSDSFYKCDCSLCKKKSIVMKFLNKENFQIISGHNFLISYKWNKKIAEHFFCKICGVYTHHIRRRDPNQISINVECIDDFSISEDDIIDLVNGSTHD